MRRDGRLKSAHRKGEKMQKPQAVSEARVIYDVIAISHLTSQSVAEVRREIARGAMGSVKRGRRRLVTARQLVDYVRRLEGENGDSAA